MSLRLRQTSSRNPVAIGRALSAAMACFAFAACKGEPRHDAEKPSGDVPSVETPVGTMDGSSSKVTAINRVIADTIAGFVGAEVTRIEEVVKPGSKVPIIFGDQNLVSFEVVSIDTKGVTLKQSTEAGMSEVVDNIRLNFGETMTIGEYALSFAISAKKGDKEGEAVLKVQPMHLVPLPFLALVSSTIPFGSEKPSAIFEKGDTILDIEFVFEFAGNARFVLDDITEEGVGLRINIEIFMSEHGSNSQFVKFGEIFDLNGLRLRF